MISEEIMHSDLERVSGKRDAGRCLEAIGEIYAETADRDQPGETSAATIPHGLAAHGGPERFAWHGSHFVMLTVPITRRRDTHWMRFIWTAAHCIKIRALMAFASEDIRKSGLVETRCMAADTFRKAHSRVARLATPLAAGRHYRIPAGNGNVASGTAPTALAPPPTTQTPRYGGGKGFSYDISQRPRLASSS